MRRPLGSAPVPALALACAAGAAVAACWTPSATPPPSAPSSSAPSPPPVAAGCRPRTVDELAHGAITEEAIRCLLPAAKVRREGEYYFAIIPGRPGPEHIMGRMEDGLAMRVDADSGPVVHVFAREVRTSLGVGVGATLGQLRAAAPSLVCGPIMSSPYMACHTQPVTESAFTFWTRGSGFRDDEAQEAKLERHADHVVIWFEYLGPNRDGPGE